MSEKKNLSAANAETKEQETNLKSTVKVEASQEETTTVSSPVESDLTTDVDAAEEQAQLADVMAIEAQFEKAVPLVEYAAQLKAEQEYSPGDSDEIDDENEVDENDEYDEKKPHVVTRLMNRAERRAIAAKRKAIRKSMIRFDRDGKEIKPQSHPINDAKVWNEDPVLENLCFTTMGGCAAWIVLPPWRDKKDCYTIEGAFFTDQDRVECEIIHRSYYKGGGWTSVGAAALADSRTRAYTQKDRRFSPAEEYIRAIEWDGKERIEIMIPPEYLADDPEYAAIVLKNFAISLVSRIVHPGCQVDSMMVLCGGQGLHKTKFFRSVFPWGCVELGDVPNAETSKDALIRCHTTNIVLFDEIDRQRRIDDQAALKSCLTTQKDRFRLPYGRGDVHPDRCFIFAATTNENDFLFDTTGNRRYWPLTVIKRIPLEYLSREWMDQCLAEAYAYVKAGQTLDYSEAFEALAQSVREGHLHDPIGEEVTSWLMAPQLDNSFVHGMPERLPWGHTLSVAFIMDHCPALKAQGLTPARNRKEALAIAAAMDRHPDYEAIGPSRVYGWSGSWKTGRQAKQTWRKKPLHQRVDPLTETPENSDPYYP